MDTLDAQCLIAHITLAEDPRLVPARWMHHADGSLRGALAGSPNDFTWRRADVAAMAERWRAMHEVVPEPLMTLVSAHLAFDALLDERGLAPPDAVIHDLEAGEVRAVWDGQGLMVVVDELQAALELGLPGDLRTG